jgi:rhamnosyltransferase
MRISVVVPVRDGGPLFRYLAGSLQRSVQLHGIEVIVIDSGSTDDTVAVAEAAGFHVHRIAPQDFGHGRTRNLGAQLATGDIVCFLTDDVLPCTPDWPQLLAAALADPTVAGAYGRQVPRDASTMEMFFVAMNYPAHRLRFDPQPGGHHPRPGRVLFSNAFSAVRRETLMRIPFPDEIGYSEDLVWAHRALAAGYSIVYEPRAEALHAHHYTMRSLFRRTYLVGRALRAHNIDGGASFSESVRFLCAEIAYFIRTGHTHRLPQLISYEFTRWAGFHSGRILGGRAERRRDASSAAVTDSFGSDPRRA